MADALPAILRCASESWRIASQSRLGPVSIGGTQQAVLSPAGLWMAEASFHLVKDDDYLEARGFLSGLDGQAGTFMAGPIDWRGQPWAVDPLFSGPLTPGRARGSALARVAFFLAAPAALNATTLSIRREAGGFLRRGQYLQIGERLHMISGPVADGSTAANGKAAPGIVNVQIRPWTRAAYGAGTPINFTQPQCLMRLADADQGGITMLPSPLSDLSLKLVEAF